MFNFLHGQNGLFRLLATVLFFSCLPLLAQTKTLGLTKKIAGNDEGGYVLFSPIGVDTTYLMNKCGQKIHTWKTQYTPGLSVYLKDNGHLLKAGTYTDTVFGFAGGRGGMIEEYDWNGNLLWSYKLFNDSLCQHHDIHLMPNGNILVLAWHSISKNKALTYGRSISNFNVNQSDLWSERIIELKPVGKDSAELVWQWDLLDHTIQDIDTSIRNFGQVDLHPELMDINYALNLKTNDWIHANSIDYNPKLDQILISAHNISEIWVIDHSTTLSEAASHTGGKFNKGGDFLYRWGNPEAYRKGSSANRKLFRQHNAHWIAGGLRDSGSILLFNNGWGRDTAYSSVDIIRTPVLSNGSYIYNAPYGPSNAAWQYTDSVKTRFYSQIISGAQMLPNGNVLICSGVQGRFFEVTANKKLVWQYRNPVMTTGIQSDGQTASNNAVFRCSYYSKNHPAFYNKSLYSLGTIERNSFPYSCNFETVAPVVKSFFPKHNDSAVAQNQVLKVQFSEAVLKRNNSVSIYANNVFYENIVISSDLVKIKNDSLFISHLKPFPVNARIAVILPSGLVSDSSNNLLKVGIDSAAWHFNTIAIAPKVLAYTPAHQSNMVALNTHLYLRYNERIFKRSTGNIVVYENGKIAEQIPINSSKIQVRGSLVEITPSNLFKENAFISMSMDSCFVDTFGTVAANLPYSDWYFRTYQSPTILTFTPALNTKAVLASTALTVAFDRPLSWDSLKPISVYENSVLKYQFQRNDSNVHFDGTALRFQSLQAFKSGARINVVLPANTWRDTFNGFFNGVDSSAWFFTIEKGSAVLVSHVAKGLQVYPNPSQGVLNLQSDQSIEIIQITDVLGRAVNAGIQQKSPFQIELSLEDKGIYLIHFKDGQRMKILIE